MREIRLDSEQQAHAYWVAQRRQEWNVAHGRKPAHGYEGDGFELHLQGAYAEYAVSLSTGLIWHSVSDDPDNLPGDVGTFQVRSTHYPNGRLVLHPDDPPDKIFILVTSEDSPHLFRIHGWLLAAEGQKEEYWRTDVREPCFMVRQKLLQPYG